MDGENVGCVAYEQPNNQKAYLNRLAVLPKFQKQGIGEALTQHVIHHAQSKGVSQVSIGIIANHTALKTWYMKLGFKENGIKEFPHLPFDVCFMTYDVPTQSDDGSHQ